MSGTLAGPSFNTGDTSWNNALGSLAHSLFPDPMRQTQAYYYGTEARKKLADTDIATSQAAAAAHALAMQMAMDRTGQPAPVPSITYHTGSVRGGPQVMDFPGVNGGPVTGGGASMATPPPPAAGGPGLIAQMFNGAITGPSTEVTGSDGVTRVSTEGQGVLHPGSITDPNGGPKQAGPAQANGSPAPPAINLGTIMALSAAAGRDANVTRATGEAAIVSAYEHGILPWPQATRISSLVGNNAPYESDQATGRTRITTGAQLEAERLRLQQQESQFRRTPGTQMGVDEEGNPTLLYPPAPGQSQPVPGPRVFNEPLERQGRDIVTTGEGGGAGTLRRQKDIGPGGAPAPTSPQERVLMQQQVDVIEMDASGKPTGNVIPMTYGEALAKKAPITAGSMEKLRSWAVQMGMSGAPQPSKAYRRGTATTTLADKVDPKELGAIRTGIDQMTDRRYAALKEAYWTRTEKAQLSEDATNAMTEHAFRIYNEGRARSMPEAMNMAYDDFVQSGALPSDTDTARGWQGIISANPNIRQGGKGVFEIPLLRRPVDTAPPGAKEGDKFRDNETGQVLEVHGRLLFPAQQQQRQYQPVK